MDTLHGFFRRNHTFIDHINRDAKCRTPGPLAGARLQHPQLALFDGELNILHIAVMGFKTFSDLLKLNICLWNVIDHRLNLGGCVGTSDHIFALGVYQEFAEDSRLAVVRITGKSHPCRRLVTGVPKHHRLHRDRCADAVIDAIESPVIDRPPVHPRVEDCGNRHA